MPKTIKVTTLLTHKQRVESYYSMITSYLKTPLALHHFSQQYSRLFQLYKAIRKKKTHLTFGPELQK